MDHLTQLSDIRREYGALCLNEENVLDCPVQQFELWFSEELSQKKDDPNAMVLSTVDNQGHPDSRVVLLKAIDEGTFVFYTNYQSTKSIHIGNNPFVALNFYWPTLARQVRIRGRAARISEAQSDAYFLSRPKLSQVSAIVSPQSRVLGSRADLETHLSEFIADAKQFVRPAYWGGYAVMPTEFEFWQGRDNRMHDRIRYYRHEEHWLHQRLAP